MVVVSEDHINPNLFFLAFILIFMLFALGRGHLKNLLYEGKNIYIFGQG